ncbi:uncharacterized protein ISCGN_005727 [Ixodes scapularis]
MRLNFGIGAAAELFQNTVRQVLAGIPGVINISDDILVYGKTDQEHNDSLEAVLQLLGDCGLTLNPKKCSFSQWELTFFGQIFSAKGMQPDPAKVQAFLDMAPPNSPAEVRRLLGMITYSGRFISPTWQTSPHLFATSQGKTLTGSGPWSIRQRGSHKTRHTASCDKPFKPFKPRVQRDISCGVLPHSNPTDTLRWSLP